MCAVLFVLVLYYRGYYEFQSFAILCELHTLYILVLYALHKQSVSTIYVISYKANNIKCPLPRSYFNCVVVRIEYGDTLTNFWGGFSCNGPFNTDSTHFKGAFRNSSATLKWNPRSKKTGMYFAQSNVVICHTTI